MPQPLSEAPHDPPLYSVLTYRVSRLNAKLNAQAIKLLKRTAGLSLIQWRVLKFLDSSGPSSPGEIARRTEFDKGQISRCVADLFKKGLVDRKDTDGDLRSFRAAITDEGRRHFERARLVMDRRQAHLSSNLTPAERRILFVAFDKLDTAAEREDF